MAVEFGRVTRESNDGVRIIEIEDTNERFLTTAFHVCKGHRVSFERNPDTRKVDNLKVVPEPR